MTKRQLEDAVVRAAGRLIDRWRQGGTYAAIWGARSSLERAYDRLAARRGKK